jgi:four helix bundle protein
VKKSVLKEKSYAFAIRIVYLYKQIIQEHKEYVLSKQVLRSGTAIGALICEAIFAQSKPDFISKLSISVKEANETIYWLTLLKDTDFIDEKVYISLHKDCEELLKMLISSLNTLKKKNE